MHIGVQHAVNTSSQYIICNSGGLPKYYLLLINTLYIPI